MSTLATDFEDIQSHLEGAERAVYANVGPSPVLVEIRAAMDIVKKWTEEA